MHQNVQYITVIHSDIKCLKLGTLNLLNKIPNPRLLLLFVQHTK
jgi:hypothetical protein